MDYDVIIVGAGPAGIFAALELAERSDLRVLIVDKGRDLEERVCPAWEGGRCRRCRPCAVLSGWGGAGAFSDGKLTLSADVGGWLLELLSASTGDRSKARERLRELIEYVDGVYVRFGAPRTVYGTDADRVEEIAHRAARCGLRLVPLKVKHLGTERAHEILLKMRRHLEGKVDFLPRTEVVDVVVKGGQVVGVRTADGRLLRSRFVILAPGRLGARWMKSLMERLGVSVSVNPVDIGVRVEVPAEVMEELTEVLYDVKLVYYSREFDDPVRTFCVNPHGEVIRECYEDVITVNGQSRLGRRTPNTNFAILVTTRFTEPFREPIEYGLYIARLANMLGGDVIVQRLGDLRRGRRSTPERLSRSIVRPTLSGATPGDLSFVLPYRILANILEMLRALDGLAPGVASDHTLLYGVEVKFYSARVDVGPNLEVRGVRGLYAIGDGAGITRGLMQASISGVLAARDILARAG